MNRGVQLVVLCEDKQHWAFVKRFLERRGWNARRIRLRVAPTGRGAGEQFVRERFPEELGGYRSNRNRVSRGLIVMLDGDAAGLTGRLRSLDESCQARGVAPRRANDRVAVFVPTRNIETWFAWLDGEPVDEKKTYPKLDRPKDCRRHVDKLVRMCDADALREPAPPALRAASKEYKRLCDAGPHPAG